MKRLRRSLSALIGQVRTLFRQIYNRYFGKIERFEGTPKEICAQIVDKLWGGTFYRTSLGHYDFFWMRDFGTSSESLVKLGHGDNVRANIRWAMHAFRKTDCVTSCIDNLGNTFNQPEKRTVDSLPWLLHAIVVSNYQLSKTEHVFLEHQLRKYIKKFLEPTTGDLKKQRYSEMRDAVFYDRSAYSIALVGRMAVCVKKLKLTHAFPYTPERYQQVLLGLYWNGDYFNADRASSAYSSESALMPFFLKVIDDKKRAGKTFDYINKAKLNKPYPLQYGFRDNEFKHRLGMGKYIMPEYTGTTLWTWHATFYLHTMKRYDRPEYQEQYDKFSALIARHKTYPELVNHDGSWYYAPVYRADPGMVWAAIFLTL